jgi:hypothetical protein
MPPKKDKLLERIQERHVKNVKKLAQHKRREAVGIPSPETLQLVSAAKKESPISKAAHRRQRRTFMLRRRVEIESPLTQLRILPDWLSRYTNTEIFDVPLLFPEGGFTEDVKKQLLAERKLPDRFDFILRDPHAGKVIEGPSIRLRTMLAPVRSDKGYAYYGDQEIKAAYRWNTPENVDQRRKDLSKLLANTKSDLILVSLRLLPVKKEFRLQAKDLNDEKTFTSIIPEVSKSKNIGKGHRNMLVISKQFRTIERFEPHGRTKLAMEGVPFQDWASKQVWPPSTAMNTIIDTMLKRLLNQLLPGYEFVSSTDICPRLLGAQTMLPLCITYSYMYFHLRILNPHLNPRQIADWMSKAGRFGFSRWNTLSGKQKGDARVHYILGYLSWILRVIKNGTYTTGHRAAIPMSPNRPVVSLGPKKGYTRPRG